MMETEFKYRKNFHMVCQETLPDPDRLLDYLTFIQMETEMIDKLDVFISGGMGDAKYRVMLYQM